MLPHIIKEVSAKSDSDYHSAAQKTSGVFGRAKHCDKIPRSFAARVFYT
jgi:hypothetical protein